MDGDVLVVDDATPDPTAIRAEALACRYHRPHPRRPWYLSVAPSAHVPTLVHTIESALGQRVHDAEPGGPGTSNGRFSLFLAGANDLISVHSDPYLRAGILYLAPHPPAGTGTMFLRDRSTGFNRRERRSDDSDLRQTAPIGSTLDLDRYDMVHEVESRFNRLVIFDATLFHAASGFHGRDLLDGRLTLNLFCNTGHPRRAT